MATKNNSDASLLSKVANVAALVDYQKGAVVSRTIVDRDAGTVTLFAFDQGQGLSEHTTPYDALVHVIDGEAIVTIDSQPLKLRSGEATIMPASHPHALRAESGFKMILVMIKGGV
jgi:quercetin dioxygenase-like cupin family protein